mmetsp:Transcript_5568/g.9287  ORF Transcript_5568/g.9287 Transcript_5568/m.9287 type:complete len:94 (+) Transcript_5568:619-900(+)
MGAQSGRVLTTKDPVFPSSPSRLFTVNSSSFPPPSSSALALEGEEKDVTPAIAAVVVAILNVASRRDSASLASASSGVEAKSGACDALRAADE